MGAKSELTAAAAGRGVRASARPSSQANDYQQPPEFNRRAHAKQGFQRLILVSVFNDDGHAQGWEVAHG